MFDALTCSAMAEQARGEWDALAATSGDLHLSSAWLDYQSTALRLPVHYGMVYADGLAAALPVFELPDRPARKFYDPCYVFEAPSCSPPEGTRRYLVGSPAGYTNDIVIRDNLEQAVRRQALRTLLTALRAAVHEHDRGHEFYMLYATRRCKEMLAAAGLVESAVATLPNYHLNLPGDTFQDYLDSFKSKRRRAIRAEMRKFASAGYTIDVRPLGDAIPVAVPLIVQLEGRHGNPSGPARTHESLAQLAEAFSGSVFCFCMRRDTEISGVAVVIRNGTMLDARAVGFDYPNLQDSYEYFNLTLYNLIWYAYEHGIRHIVLAPTSGDAKLQRGAVEVPSYGLRLRIPLGT